MSAKPGWMLAAVAAVLLHSLLLLNWPTQSAGIPSPPPGPSLAMSNSMASILGKPVEVETEETVRDELKPQEMAEEPLVEPQALAAVDPLQAPEVTSEPADLPVLNAVEPEPVETAVISPPKIKKAITKKKKKTVKKKQRKAKPKKKARKKAKRNRKAAKRGTGRKGQTGKRQRSGGGGKRRASAGQIATFKSRVRARIAGCVRSRVSGRGGGRVVIRFGVSSGGRARGVSAGGSSALRGIAASAARGCSFPKPPLGAGGLRFSFPVSVR